MSDLLKNQRILLTGASGDLGIAMLERFLHEGATVTATVHRHPERLEKFSQNPNCRAFAMDVTKTDSVQAAYDAITSEGSLDSIVHNSGITRDGPLLGLEDEDWLNVIEINLSGSFRVARAFGKILFRKKQGKILFVSSVAGTRGGRGQANYAASKAGIEAMVRSLAAEMALRGVLVNAIAPGPIDSRMTKDVMSQAGEEVLRRIALGRLGKPEEIAGVAAHLLSVDFSYMTGQIIHIDGGFGL